MFKYHLLTTLIFFVFIVSGFAKQYDSAIYINPNIIGEKDISVFDTVTFTGWTYQEIFDRRKMEYSYEDVAAYQVQWDNGNGIEIQVHKELFEHTNSEKILSDYVIPFAYRVGQLPRFILDGIKRVVLLKGDERWSAALGSIYIHVDDEDSINSGYVEEVLIHEGGHAALDEKVSNSLEWKEAQLKDSIFISKYAAENHDEDLTESLIAWIAVKYRNRRISTSDSLNIVESIPFRLAYLDSLKLDMYPFDEPHEFDHLYEVNRNQDQYDDLEGAMTFDEFLFRAFLVFAAVILFLLFRYRIRKNRY